MKQIINTKEWTLYQATENHKTEETHKSQIISQCFLWKNGDYLADILYICRLVFNDYKKFMIVLSNNNENKAMGTIPYKDEKELQEILFHNPILLQNEDEDVTLYPIQREINLSESGKLDILCIDSNAKITAVEVKLASNSQARREVVGQIFDYISYLYGLSFHELNTISNNQLQLIINNNDFNIEKDFIEKEIDTNLRNADIRLIIAVDNINDNLNRIINFISVIAKIDIRLITISKFKTVDAKELFISNTVIKSSDKAPAPSEFQELITYFNANSKSNYKTSDSDREKTYRRILIPGWPEAIHYEFSYLNKNIDNIFIDLHIEDKNWHALYHDVVEKFIEKKVKDYEIIKRRYGTKSKWIGISVPYSAGNEKITQCMDELIKLTKDSITNYIQQNN